MSAYVVDRDHIRYLVAAAAGRAWSLRGSKFSWWSERRQTRISVLSDDYPGLTEDGMTESEFGQMLWDENIRSVRYWYDDPDTLPGPIDETFVYIHVPVAASEDPVQTLKAIHCLEYQSCEHPEWKDSEAYAALQALAHRAIRALPGYDDAGWDAPSLPSLQGVSILSLQR